MVVEDPQHLVDLDFANQVLAGIDQFASWTTMEGVCVPSVRIVEELSTKDGTTYAGGYSAAHIPIALSSTTQFPDLIIQHELCHAWDDQMDRPSERLTDLFIPDEELDPALYITEREIARETFANICDDGPVEARIYAAIEERCGVVGPDRQWAWMRENVFGRFPLEPLEIDWAAADPSNSREPLDLATLLHTDGIWDVAPCGSSLCVLTVGPHPDYLYWLSGPKARIGGDFKLWAISPHTAEARELATLPRGRRTSAGMLLGGPDGVLVVRRALTLQASWWDAADGSLSEVPLPEELHDYGLTGSATRQGAWLMRAYQEDAVTLEKEEGSWYLDFDTHALTAFASRTYWSPTIDYRGWAHVVDPSTEERLSLGPGGEEERSPLDLPTFPGHLTTLSDGSWVFGFTRPALQRPDDTGRLWLLDDPEATCDPHQWSPYRFIQLGDELWALDYYSSRDEDGTVHQYLTPLGIPAPPE